MNGVLKIIQRTHKICDREFNHRLDCILVILCSGLLMGASRNFSKGGGAQKICEGGPLNIFRQAL